MGESWGASGSKGSLVSRCVQGLGVFDAQCRTERLHEESVELVYDITDWSVYEFDRPKS